MDENEIKSLIKSQNTRKSQYKIIKTEHRIKGAYDTEIDTFEELDETGRPIFKHTVTSTTLMPPPTHTKVSHHRENIE